MKAVFIETSGFTGLLGEYLSDAAYHDVQKELLNNPNARDVMPGCGGLRKYRTRDSFRGKGKRGGARLIYLYVPEAKCFLLLDIYGKAEKDDLSLDEKKMLRALSEQFRKSIVEMKNRQAKGTKNDNQQ